MAKKNRNPYFYNNPNNPKIQATEPQIPVVEEQNEQEYTQQEPMTTPTEHNAPATPSYYLAEGNNLVLTPDAMRNIKEKIDEKDMTIEQLSAKLHQEQVAKKALAKKTLIWLFGLITFAVGIYLLLKKKNSKSEQNSDGASPSHQNTNTTNSNSSTSTNKFGI